MKGGKGRPSDYEELDLDQVRVLLEKGWTDQELADFFKKSRTTISTWKKVHADFLDTVNLGKDEADRKVERSLFERATGYACAETHITVIGGKVVKTPLVKRYPPDPASMIFWLKNRKPGSWREKTEVQDDRLTALLNHMHRLKEAPHGKENRKPQAR
jgi:hypothetical protein